MKLVIETLLLISLASLGFAQTPQGNCDFFCGIGHFFGNVGNGFGIFFAKEMNWAQTNVLNKGATNLDYNKGMLQAQDAKQIYLHNTFLIYKTTLLAQSSSYLKMLSDNGYNELDVVVVRKGQMIYAVVIRWDSTGKINFADDSTSWMPSPTSGVIYATVAESAAISISHVGIPTSPNDLAIDPQVAIDQYLAGNIKIMPDGANDLALNLAMNPPPPTANSVCIGSRACGGANGGTQGEQNAILQQLNSRRTLGCPMNIQPVCTADGTVYPTPCDARNAGHPEANFDNCPFTISDTGGIIPKHRVNEGLGTLGVY